jgi:hypothetical protein
MKGIIKSQILSSLHSHFGNTPFKYTDIVKHVLMNRGIINSPSEYNWETHRGYYSCAINRYNSEYLYNCTTKNPWRLVKEIGPNGKPRYRVENC